MSTHRIFAKGMALHPPLLWMVNNGVTFELCSQKFNLNQQILLKSERLIFCSKSERLIFKDLANIYQKFVPNEKFGPVSPKELCVCLHVFSVFFPFPFFFYSWPDLNLRLGLYPHNAPTYWLHLGRVSPRVTICLVVKADLFWALL